MIIGSEHLLERPALVAVVVLIVVVYAYAKRHHKYWELRGVPGPLPWAFVGTYARQFLVPMQVLEEERFERYGPIYGIYDGSKPGLIVGRPDLVSLVMKGTVGLRTFANRRAVKTTHKVMSNFISSLEGAEWKRVRAIIAPTFTTGKLKSIMPIMGTASKAMLEVLEATSAGTGPEVADEILPQVNVKTLFGSYTMDVIAMACFGTTADQCFVKQASLLFTFPFWRKFLDYTAPRFVLDRVFGFTVLPKGPMDFFRDVTLRTIRERRASGERPADFLQLLMDANTTGYHGARRKLSESEILAQAVLFFSVGYETSSQLLMYSAYCLAHAPKWQERLYAELRLHFNDEQGGELHEAFHLLRKLPVLTAVIKETLRLYNPVLRMERRASSDFELGDTGITVPAGMIVGIPVWALHHSNKHYHDPTLFDPERFLPDGDAVGAAKASIYLPFGQGPRDCIGKHFSLLESKLALAEVVLRYRLAPGLGSNGKLRFAPTGRPLLGPQDVHVGVARRQRSGS